jgi:fatty-acyl-CoA synthase
MDYEALRKSRASEPVMSTMMRMPLSIPRVLARAEELFGTREVISRVAPGEFMRTTYAEVAKDSRRLGAVLMRRGIGAGQRVATLMWNHSIHLAAYFGVPAIGAVLHPLNPRLAAEELAYIIADAGDVAIIVDADLLPLWDEVSRHVHVPHVIVYGGGAMARASGHPSLSQLIGAHDAGEVVLGDPADENDAVCICYTSGTTGRPRGVVYSHRSLVLQCLALCSPDALGISGRDTLLLLAPMFHVNAWTIPFVAPMFGARLVLPGARISSAEILSVLGDESVSAAFAVPTVWSDALKVLEREPGRWQLPPGLRIYSGGAHFSESLFRRLHALGARCQTGWGMTEVSSMASQAWLRSDLPPRGSEGELRYLASNGIALPLFSLRHVNESGREAARDGATLGELQVRGPTVTGNYLGQPLGSAQTADGWLPTGDIVTIDAFGYVRLVDRLKDLVKSGGEWISSIEMESVLNTHPEVSESAVVALPDERWGERPLAIVVCRAGWAFKECELREHLAVKFPKWMLPDRIVQVTEMPKTAVGKLNKAELRRRFASTPNTSPGG